MPESHKISYQVTSFLVVALGNCALTQHIFNELPLIGLNQIITYS